MYFVFSNYGNVFLYDIGHKTIACAYPLVSLALSAIISAIDRPFHRLKYLFVYR